MRGRRLHRSATVLFSCLMTVIGVALVVQALSGHGGAISPRLLLGGLFVAAGLGRIYVERKRGGA